jgi:SOS response associated peptidase (SRAP)
MLCWLASFASRIDRGRSQSPGSGSSDHLRSASFGREAKRTYLSPMCGRVRLSSDVSEIRLVFRIPPERPIPNFPPSWNAAPTDALPVVRFDAKAGQRSLDLLRWGLV